MNNHQRKLILLISLALLGGLVWLAGGRSALAQSDTAVTTSSPGANTVHAVLFFSPTCGHCEYIRTEVLPPLQAQYGEQLSVTEVDVSQIDGQQIYQRALLYFMVPDSRRGVPTMIVGDTVLVGSLEVEEQLPVLTDAGLAGDGVMLPSLYGLATEPGAVETDVADSTAVADAAPIPDSVTIPDTVPVASETAVVETSSGVSGYWLAMLVLLLAIGALLYSAWRLVRGELALAEPPAVRSVLIPLLCVVGLGVAGYLAYVETQQVLAVCGPVGDCNTVQSSSYAVLMGVPVAVWGFLSYVTVLGLWGLQFVSNANLRRWAAWAMLALAAFATAFSIYLTALELFVIHAVCAWCLTSAVVSVAILLVVVTAVATRQQPSKPRFAM